LHPGAGRGSAPLFPKGRVLQDHDVAHVRAIIGPGPHARDRLIEYLHQIQDKDGCLRLGRLHGLAELMRLSMAEVYEVATFYAHFDVVDDEAVRPEIVVRVCTSLSCQLAGGEALHKAMAKDASAQVRVIEVPCTGACDKAPVAYVGLNEIAQADPGSLSAAIATRSVDLTMPVFRDLASYRAAGGYARLEACLDGSLSPETIIAQLSDAGLRGLGGAGFPTGRKWGLVRAQQGPRLMAVNGDEGEPGTFKDRHYLETDPHAFLEGMLIGAFVVEARDTYIYLRDEYPAARAILQGEIDTLVAAGLSRHTRIHLRRGAGAYICGEESAMIESIEGKRGLPRHRPPYVAEVGLFGQPTLVNNIETLFWIPAILEKGAAWFASQGQNGAMGLRSYSVSGRVARPGVVLAPAGTTARELIARCGGMAAGHVFKAYLPGGASGGILPAALADEPLEFGRLEAHGAFVGSHAVVVLSDQDNMKAVARNLMRFFAHESCGQCTPCRGGTEKSLAMMQRDHWDIGVLEDIATVMRDASICGLGQAASNPMMSVICYFPEDLR
jgi:formate dehydrogenase